MFQLSSTLGAQRDGLPEGLSASRKEKTKNMKTKQIKLPGPDHPIRFNVP
jgi:hypothetical protein